MAKSDYFYYDLEGNYIPVRTHFKTIVARIQKTLKALPKGSKIVNKFITIEGAPVVGDPYINLHTFVLGKVYRVTANSYRLA